MRKLLVLAVALTVLVGCEQTATPLPVALQITDTPVPTSEVPRLRFAYSVDALAAFAGRDTLAEEADLLIYDPQVDIQTPYDVVVILGTSENSTLAPQPISVRLILDTTQPPLDDPEVERLVRLAFDPTRLAGAFGYLSAAPVSENDETVDPARVRTELANMGYPDGLPVTVLSECVPGSEALLELLRPFAINVRLITENGSTFPSSDADAAIVGSNPAWLSQMDAADVIDLYTVPISYRAGDGIALSFDAQGFPVLQN